MNSARYRELMDSQEAMLTIEEVKEGWHFCGEFDGLLVGREVAPFTEWGNDPYECRCGLRYPENFS